MAVHSARLATDAVVALLTAASIVAGDGEKPTSGGWQDTPGQSVFAGYVVVHAVSGGVTDGPIGDPDADAYPLYQLSTYGATRDQCEALQDNCRASMLDGTLSISGRTVAHVYIDMLDGARRDDDSQPPLWVGVGRYRVVTSA